jgi:phosphoglycolate phosphatase-like HAD superfamily hydrolase
LPGALALARDAGRERAVVVSGALQHELRTVFAEQKIDDLFGQVLGSPTSKLELVESVMKRRDCPPERALLIGDGAGDFRVCRALGMHFAFLAEFSDWKDAERELAHAPLVSRHASWVELLGALKIGYTGEP